LGADVDDDEARTGNRRQHERTTKLHARIITFGIYAPVSTSLR
jgi:hypothetical protein